MKISYCTTCFNRLWQLKQTLEHNLAFMKTGESELCILSYNDDSTEPYLYEKYADYIEDGRLKVKTHHDDYKPVDGSDFACGYVKNLSHAMGSGEILFNLDADNFITQRVNDELSQLDENQVLIIDPRKMNSDGRSGRIGVHSLFYKVIGGYHDTGRSDDSDFIRRSILAGANLKYTDCDLVPISNIQEDIL